MLGSCFIICADSFFCLSILPSILFLVFVLLCPDIHPLLSISSQASSTDCIQSIKTSLLQSQITSVGIHQHLKQGSRPNLQIHSRPLYYTLLHIFIHTRAAMLPYIMYFRPLLVLFLFFPPALPFL